MEILQKTDKKEYQITFSEDELKVIYAKLMGIEPLYMPEDLMKILMSIRKALKWYDLYYEEES